MNNLLIINYLQIQIYKYCSETLRQVCGFIDVKIADKNHNVNSYSDQFFVSLYPAARFF